jgi:hypothetical protein
MRFPLFAAVLLIAPLGACGSDASDTLPATETPTEAASPTETPPETPPTDAAPAATGAGTSESTCGADKLGRWLNVLPSEDMKAEIAAAVGERPIRYYTQGDPITMDFSEARLNVELGVDGRIKLFRCG